MSSVTWGRAQGATLAWLREAAGYPTQRDFREALGSSVSFWEAGHRAPSFENICRMAGVLGLTPDTLMWHFCNPLEAPDE